MRVSAGKIHAATHINGLLRISLLVTTATIGIFAAGGAWAESYKVGDVDLSIDTTITAGASMRAVSRDCTHISIPNGGCGAGNKTTGVNSDNGDLNFDRGDLTSAGVKGLMDIQATWQNYGAFVRPRAFYDAVYTRNDMNFMDLTRDAKGKLDYEVKIMDAFVYGNWDVDSHPVSLRVGKQVVNWGESMFIPGGINVFQSIDLNALRRPGAELKDALTPMPMIYASAGLTDALTIDAFWQFDQSKSDLDPSGSYFSTDDIVGPGSLAALSGIKPGYDNPANVVYGTPAQTNPNAAIGIRRNSDLDGSSTNQYGMSAHYYADQLGSGTDLGLYYVRYTSKLPYLTFQNGKATFSQSCSNFFGSPSCYNSALITQAVFAWGANQGNYYYQFPDKIDMFGASFNTNVMGTALSGEVTYTPNMPMATESTQQNASQIDGLGAGTALSGGTYTGSWSSLTAAGPGASAEAIKEKNVWQAQFSTITSFTTSDQIPVWLKADGATFLFNFGIVYAPDVTQADALNRPGPEGGIPVAAAAKLLQPGLNGLGVTDVQYATSFSDGYQAVFTWDYNNPFDVPVTLSPFVQWRQDITGYSPGPNTANYSAGNKQISIGTNVTYQSSWKGTVSYTNYFGGGFDNPNNDRDYISASISYAF